MEEAMSKAQVVAFDEEWVTYSGLGTETCIRCTIEVHRLWRYGEPHLGQEVQFEEHPADKDDLYTPTPAYYYLLPKGTNDTRGVREEVGRRVPRKAAAGRDDGSDEPPLFALAEDAGAGD